MFEQLSLADVLNEMNVPISPGDYIEHESKPGTPLLVVEGPFLSWNGNPCLKVKMPTGEVLPVRLDYVKRI